MDHMNFGRTMHGGIVLVKELWIKLGEQFAKIDLAKKKRHTRDFRRGSFTHTKHISEQPAKFAQRDCTDCKRTYIHR